MSTIVYDWPKVAAPGPIDAAHIAPWEHLQTVAPDRLVAIPGNPITGRFSARFTITGKGDRGDPKSPNPRAEVYSGGNGAGIIPMETLAFHGWAFTPISGNTTTWVNWCQLHGAVKGSQPCLQIKTDHNGGLYARTNPNGQDHLLATATPYGRLVRIIAAVRPSTVTTGVLQVWMALDDGAFVQMVDFTGHVGFASTYPKGSLYGDAGGAGFPWVNVSHSTVINAASFDEVKGLLALGGAITPPPPPNDPCADVKAELATVTAERDAATATLSAIRTALG